MQHQPLRHEWSGYWSRRITNEHRIVYRVEGDTVYVAQWPGRPYAGRPSARATPGRPKNADDRAQHARALPR